MAAACCRHLAMAQVPAIGWWGAVARRPSSPSPALPATLRPPGCPEVRQQRGRRRSPAATDHSGRRRTKEGAAAAGTSFSHSSPQLSLLFVRTPPATACALCASLPTALPPTKMATSATLSLASARLTSPAGEFKSLQRDGEPRTSPPPRMLATRLPISSCTLCPTPSLSPAAHLKLRLMSWNDGQALHAKVRQGCVWAGGRRRRPPPVPTNPVPPTASSGLPAARLWSCL